MTSSPSPAQAGVRRFDPHLKWHGHDHATLVEPERPGGRFVLYTDHDALLRERDARIAELEDINARLAGNLQEPREYSTEEALRIARLWRAGKMIGGDPQGVINALLTATEATEQAHRDANDAMHSYMAAAEAAEQALAAMRGRDPRTDYTLTVLTPDQHGLWAVLSPDLPGLILSGRNLSILLADVPQAVAVLRQLNAKEQP